MDAAPVLPPTCPLFRNIHHRQIQHFQQTVVRRENALGFCDLPQLPVKALDRVRGIDQTADFLRIFEVGAEVGPVFPPRLCDLGMVSFPLQIKENFSPLVHPNAATRMASMILTRDGFDFPVYFIALKIS